MRSWLALCVVVGVCGAAAADDGDNAIYDHEAIGPLRAKMTDKQLIDVLGAPAKKPKPVQEAATGEWVSAWEWADATALLVSDHTDGPWSARDVSTTRASWSTKKAIHVGSTRAALEKAYTRAPDSTGGDSSYLVGSPYGGMLFALHDDRVTSISIGVFAF
jgi:hypothetical protein